MNIKELTKDVHQNAIDHGWWEEKRSDGEIISLFHSECSEALECLRDGTDNKQCDKPIPLTCLEEELADIVIRVMDYAGSKGIDLEKAIIAKHEYNKTRPYKHGKKF